MAEARIGPIALPAAGARAAGRFTFARDAGLEKYDWPYIAISGVSSGPVALVTAGIYGHRGGDSPRPVARPGQSARDARRHPATQSPGLLRAERLRESRGRR